MRCDGSAHDVALSYDAPSGTYALYVDGELDASASFGAGDPAEAPAGWVIEVGHSWGIGENGSSGAVAAEFVSNVSYSYSVSAAVSQLHLEGLELRFVGAGAAGARLDVVEDGANLRESIGP